MAGETSFRIVEEPVPAQEPSLSVSKVSETPIPHSGLPPSLYLESKKPPLFLEILGGTGAYEHFDMGLLSRETDKYLNSEVIRLGLEDSPASYRKVLDSALEKLGLPEGTDIYATVEKLTRWLRIQNKLYTALREKEDLMAADPLTLSAAKLKIYLEKGYGLH